MSKQIKLPLAEAEGLIREELAGGGSVVINIHGTSMLPLLKEGITNVSLESPVFPLKKYQTILYKRPDGQFVLHRILSCKKGGLVCRGDHQAIKEFPVKKEWVIAVMTAYSKEDGWVETTSLSQKLLGAFLGKTGGLRLKLRGIKSRLCRLFGRKRA